MSISCICVLCGLPGAGKTTLTKCLQQDNNINFVPICYDNLIPWIDFSDPDILSTWKSYRNEVLLLVKFFIGVNEKSHQDCFNDFLKNIDLINKEHIFYLYELIKKLKSGKNKIVFVIDDNMQYRRMRYEYFQIARNCKIGFCTIMIDCSFQICQQRNQQRPIGEIVKLKSLRRINAQMEMPDSTKAAWEKYFCIIKLEKNEINSVLPEVFNVIQLALENPVFPLPEHNEELTEKARLANRNSLGHQADLCLRKLISEFMQQQKDPKKFSQKISLAKKYILYEITSGLLDEQDYLTNSGAIDQELLTSKLNAYLSSFLND